MPTTTLGNNIYNSAILRFCLTTKRNNAIPIADQRPAGLHPPSLGTIPVLRTNVQPGRTPATATTSERRLRLGMVPATIRGWYDLIVLRIPFYALQFLTICSSPLRQIPLPSHAQLRTLPSPLPLRFPRSRRQDRVWRRQHGVREQRRVQSGRGC